MPVSEMHERASSSSPTSVSMQSLGKGMMLVCVMPTSLLVPVTDTIAGDRATVAEAFDLGPLSEKRLLPLWRLRVASRDDERERLCDELLLELVLSPRGEGDDEVLGLRYSAEVRRKDWSCMIVG